MLRTLVVDGFSLLCAIAGWFYLFYSKAASRLAPVESRRLNMLRVRLRRICGAAMFLLAVAFFAGFNTVDERTPQLFLAVWLGVLILLLAVVALALADLRLTWRLHHRRDQK